MIQLNLPLREIEQITSIHVPKTGGVLFRDLVLKPLFGEENIFIENTEKRIYRKRRMPSVPEEAAKYDVVHGHFRYSRYAWLGRPVVTWVRDPMERLRSHYIDVQRMWKERTNELYAPGLNEFAVKYGNQYPQFFDAKKGLKMLTFVGILEFFEESMVRFYRWLGVDERLFDPTAYLCKRVEKYGPYVLKLSNRAKKNLRPLLEPDYQIYNELLRRFDRGSP